MKQLIFMKGLHSFTAETVGCCCCRMSYAILTNYPGSVKNHCEETENWNGHYPLTGDCNSVCHCSSHCFFLRPCSVGYNSVDRCFAHFRAKEEVCSVVAHCSCRCSWREVYSSAFLHDEECTTVCHSLSAYMNCRCFFS